MAPVKKPSPLTRSDWTLLAIDAGGASGLSPVQIQKVLFLLGENYGELTGKVELA
jgi:hypothetical protein